MYAFSSFMREYLNPVVKADQCAQYVDDTMIAANNDADLIRNNRAVFKWICQAGLKPTIQKWQYKIRNFPGKLRFPKSKKAVQRHL